MENEDDYDNLLEQDSESQLEGDSRSRIPIVRMKTDILKKKLKTKLKVKRAREWLMKYENSKKVIANKRKLAKMIRDSSAAAATTDGENDEDQDFGTNVDSRARTVNESYSNSKPIYYNARL